MSSDPPDVTYIAAHVHGQCWWVKRLPFMNGALPAWCWSNKIHTFLLQAVPPKDLREPCNKSPYPPRYCFIYPIFLFVLQLQTAYLSFFTIPFHLHSSLSHSVTCVIINSDWQWISSPHRFQIQRDRQSAWLILSLCRIRRMPLGIALGGYCGLTIQGFWWEDWRWIYQTTVNSDSFPSFPANKNIGVFIAGFE